MSAIDAQRTTCRTTVAYWLLSLLLVVFVALCTGNRDVINEADAWEHHRSIRALVVAPDFAHAGNPTFLSDVPSIRYSPYVLVQAALCRSFGFDAYNVLSGAAVLNTLLLCVGLWMFVRAWDEGRSALLALICIVGLWGVAPGYAGTTALADLPWHQVNPSAFSFATSLIALALLRRWTLVGGAWRWMVVCAIGILAMLDHAMTGAFALLALLITAAFAPARRTGAIPGVCAVAAIALGCCLTWPYYPFLDALRTRLDTVYWLNRGVMRLMILQWCAPALVLSLAALLRADRPLVRFCLTVAAAGLVFTLASLPLGSPTFARFLMPATVFAQVGIAAWAWHSGALSIATWRRLIPNLRSRSDASAPAVLLAMFAIALAYGLLPQLITVLREPHLARPLVARLKPVEDKQRHLKPLYDTLLADIGERDVVMADPLTAWPVPSSRGRIVAALHYERFIVDQPQRDADVAKFFAPDATDEVRRDIAGRHHVRWVVVDLTRQHERTTAVLLARCAERRRVGQLVLLDASGL